MTTHPLRRPGVVVASAVLAVCAATVALGGGAAGAATPRSSATHVTHRSVDGTVSGVSRRATDALMSGSHGTANSLDWAGYAVTGTSLTSASGSWVQPAVVCSGKKALQSAFWVGIDGYASTDPTVQQIGTDADCTKGTNKVPSAPSYYAWFELFPNALVTLDTATHPVTAGDVLTGSVSESGTSVTLTLVDAGHWTYSTTQTATSVPLEASAEWIAEAPSVCKAGKCKPVGLADFGSVAFTGATADGLPVDSTTFTEHQVTMTKNKKGTIVKASTSLLTAGTAFTVTWVSS